MLSAAILQEKDTKLLTKVDFPQEETPWWVSLLPDPKPEQIQKSKRCTPSTSSTTKGRRARRRDSALRRLQSLCTTDETQPTAAPS